MKHFLLAIFLFTVLFPNLSRAGLYNSMEKTIPAFEKELSTFETENKPLNIAYTLLHNKENDQICYIEAFNRKEVVPPFAEPATYEEALLVERPPFPKCSEEEIALTISYSDISLLDGEGIELAISPLLSLGMFCGFSFFVSYFVFTDFRREAHKKSLLKGEEPDEEKVERPLIPQIFMVGATALYHAFHFWLPPEAVLSKNALAKPALMRAGMGALTGASVALACGAAGMQYSLYHISTEEIVEDLKKKEEKEKEEDK